MALIVDHQQSNNSLKHFCRICKKGFGCGRALGGHMRAHESSHIDDEDQASDWEEGVGVPPAAANKRMYALRTNPNRLKTCRVCENCGKEFLSWKSFLEHGKCTSDDAESLVSSPASDAGDFTTIPRGGGWSKRKRSLRAKVGIHFNSPSSEEEDLANCLMMLSNAAADPSSVAEPEESCASASKDEDHPLNFMASLPPPPPPPHHKARGVFECKACKKVFNSHQALGGHRASHKKVKGCFAARLDHDVIAHDDFFPSNPKSQHPPLLDPSSSSKRKSKVHECSICHRVFSSGQALGGHKRCHWITANAPPDASRFPALFQDTIERKLETMEALDLNLPAPVDELAAAGGGGLENVKRLSFEMSTEMYFQPWIGVKADDNVQHSRHHRQHHSSLHNHNHSNNNNNNNTTSINGAMMMMQNVEDEADSKVKLAKLSELKDINISEGSSPWLQVGIGSTTDVAADP